MGEREPGVPALDAAPFFAELGGGVADSIANANHNACGARIRDCPITFSKPLSRCWCARVQNQRAAGAARCRLPRFAFGSSHRGDRSYDLAGRPQDLKRRPRLKRPDICRA
jgi:hypothetical protein